MAGAHEIWLTDDTGHRLLLLDNIISGFFGRVANGAGRFMLNLPPESFDTSLLIPANRDYMIQFWRKPEGGVLSLFRVYFLRWWNLRREGTELAVQIRGPDVNDLTRRRHVINYADTAGSEKSDFVDDMMKEIIDDQLITDISDPAAVFGSRTVPGLTVHADVSAGPTLDANFAWRRVASILNDLNRASRVATPEVFWDIREVIGIGTIDLIFQTWTGQPGADRSDRVIFDEARGNLKNPEYTYDALDEQSYIYGGGQRTGEDRNIQQVYSAARIGVSRYNRCEGFAFASFGSSDNAVREAGRDKLTSGEPIETFTAQAIDTEGTRFGRDWNWGDLVTARFLGREYETIVRKATIFLDDNRRETIDARLEYIS